MGDFWELLELRLSYLEYKLGYIFSQSYFGVKFYRPDKWESWIPK